MGAPLRRHDLPPITDGACAVVIARADKAREMCEHPVWITGFSHYSDLHNPGMRDLTASRSTTLAAEAAGVHDGPVDAAEIQSAYTHEEPLLVARSDAKEIRHLCRTLPCALVSSCALSSCLLGDRQLGPRCPVR